MIVFGCNAYVRVALLQDLSCPVQEWRDCTTRVAKFRFFQQGKLGRIDMSDRISSFFQSVHDELGDSGS